MPSFLNNRFFWLCVAVAICLSYTWMSPEVTAPNERSRMYLTISIVEDGDITLDDEVSKYGKPFDLAESDGHFYTDKAPGSSVLAVPFYWAYRQLGGSDSIEKGTNFARKFVMVPFSILALVLLRNLLLGLGIAEPTANRTSVAFILGTSMFHYGAALFGHALVACAALGSAYAMLRAKDCDDVRRKTVWQAAVGLSGGIAFAIEYQAVLICFAIVAGYLTIPDHRNPSAVVPPLLGAVIPIALVFLYNDAAFGGPLQTGYGHLYHAASENIHSEGLYGITLPSLDALYGLILSPSRGIVLCAPVVALGFLGFGALWRRSQFLTLYVGVSAFTYIGLVAGSSIWYGGWGFGPRLLIPIFGLMAIPAATLLDSLESPALSAAAYTYAACGVLYNGFVTSMFPEMPRGITAPLKSVAVPLAQMGSPSPNLGITFFGLEGLVSTLPLFVMLAGVCLYLLAGTTSWRNEWKRTTIIAIGGTALFGMTVYGYPETDPSASPPDFPQDVSELRIWAE